MALGIENKKSIVADVESLASKSLSVVAADYRGVTSSDMTELRARARQSGVQLRVVRNTLARLAFANTNFECLSEVLVGPILLAFAQEEPGATARLLRDYAKKNPNLEVKALSVGSGLLDKSKLDVVASLPNKEEAIAMLMSVMQAPITKFVQTLAEPHAKLTRTLAAVRDKKQDEA
ncbi:MAG: 50S ribosomal protein L10 [Francisellaceae bacterium]|jgi:large subunit ribosomal protein L10|nr:50S ribosomal protein L10 [Francisellaceae bacterium]MBT6207935.1 50S ribosomal protein L10 [Francisellaceae bacterium]MBT6539584.1 50S ribosomal protein L10 [Francisellaceae bacterium]